MKLIQWAVLLFCTAAIWLSCTQERLVDEPGNLLPKTVMEDPTLPAITVNGARLHTEAFGHPDSPMVVCIHGGPGSDYRYMLATKDLAERGFRVVFYDQMGSGLSQRFDADYYRNMGPKMLDYFYDELAGVIAHYRTSPRQKVFLLGHSWGGMMATGFIGRYPQAIKGVVVGEPGGLEWDEVLEYVGNQQRVPLWSEYINNALFLDQFLTARANQHIRLDYKMAILTGASQPNSGDNVTVPASVWRPGAVINAVSFENGNKYPFSLTQGLSQYTTPVLYLHSQKNTAHALAWAQKIAAHYPKVELFQTPGGHSDMLEPTIWKNVTRAKVLAYLNAR